MAVGFSGGSSPRSASLNDLLIPPVHCLTVGASAFPIFWKNLLVDVKSTDSLPVFHLALKD